MLEAVHRVLHFDFAKPLRSLLRLRGVGAFVGVLGFRIFQVLGGFPGDFGFWWWRGFWGFTGGVGGKAKV